MTFTLERFVTGPIETNTYVIYNDALECLIIDPSSGCKAVLDYVVSKKLSLLGIIITHGHFDHIAGIPEITALYPSTVTWIHSAERTTLTNPRHNMSYLLGASFSYDGAACDLDEGEFVLGNIRGKVYWVPGHSPGGCALHIDKYLLCGDILFASSVGRTDFPGGDHETLIQGITSKIMVLDDETIVCPGHGGRTTVGRERRMNPYL